MPRALIVVDVQNDFCPGGSLAVESGDAVARRISDWIRSGTEDYALVVATMDWHPPPGGPAPFSHFSDHPDYVATWPPHCVAGSPGAELHPDLSLPHGTVIIRKGQDSAAYSGFDGHDDQNRSLAEVLRRRGIDAVDVVGLATDYCVKATAMDARANGLSVRVLSPMIAGVGTGSTQRSLEDMRAAGISITEPPANSQRSGPAPTCTSQGGWTTTSMHRDRTGARSSTSPCDRPSEAGTRHWS